MNCQILKLLFCGSNTQAVSYRCINFKCFKRNITSFLRCHKLKRTHIVKSVRKLYDDYSYIVRHGKQHFSDIFRLLLLFCRKRNSAKFCNAVNEACDFLAKLLFESLKFNIGVLNGIVQNRRRNGLCVHSEVQKDIRNSYRMDNIRLTRISELCLMSV